MGRKCIFLQKKLVFLFLFLYTVRRYHYKEYYVMNKSHRLYTLLAVLLVVALCLSIVPVIVFYLICQKHIIKGVAAGAVKG